MSEERWNIYARDWLRSQAASIREFRGNQHAYRKPQPLPYQESRNLRVELQLLLEDLDKEIERQDAAVL